MGSLKAALKAFFPNNNGDTNFSSSCLVPYFDSSQNPKGCVTTSKLASVLGVNYKTIQTNDDLNNEKFKVCGDVYVCISSTIGNSVTNTPNDGIIGAFRLEIVPCAGTNLPMQRLYRAARISAQVYVRYYEGSWGSWQRLDNFGCNTLAELKAALANV